MPLAKANSLEESIIRTLNEKYKDFTVDEAEEKRISLGDWDATKLPAPRRSQSWLCCPTIYKRNDGTDENVERRFFKDDLHIQNSSVTVAPKLNSTQPIQLQTEMLDLSQRLQRSENGRHVVEQQLRESLQERERTHRQLESLASTHESRITEMHCIIVELSKKLKTKEEAMIAEEPEGSGELQIQLGTYIVGFNLPSVSELSFQEGSVYNSDMEEVHALESQTEPLDMKLEQPDRQSANESQTSFPNLLPAPNFITESGSLNRIDVLQDEVLHLRAQVALLESQLAATTKESESHPRDPMDEILVSAPEAVQRVPVIASHGVSVGPIVPKMAERVKLKRTNDEDYITGSEITNTGVSCIFTFTFIHVNN